MKLKNDGAKYRRKYSYGSDSQEIKTKKGPMKPMHGNSSHKKVQIKLTFGREGAGKGMRCETKACHRSTISFHESQSGKPMEKMPIKYELNCGQRSLARNANERAGCLCVPDIDADSVGWDGRVNG